MFYSIMDDRSSPRGRGLAWALGIAFAIAMVMGPGPGLHLINPEPGAAKTVVGLPIVYAWGLLWFGVQVVLLLTAYVKLWSRSKD